MECFGEKVVGYIDHGRAECGAGEFWQTCQKAKRIENVDGPIAAPNVSWNRSRGTTSAIVLVRCP